MCAAGHRENNEHGTSRAARTGASEHGQTGSRRRSGYSRTPQEPRELRAGESLTHHHDPRPRRSPEAQQQLHLRDDDDLQTGAVCEVRRGPAQTPAHEACTTPTHTAPIQQLQLVRGGKSSRDPHREDVSEHRCSSHGQFGRETRNHVALAGRWCGVAACVGEVILTPRPGRFQVQKKLYPTCFRFIFVSLGKF